MPDYRAIGQRIAQQVGVPWDVWQSLIQHESGWNPSAVSPAGAIGFGQLMPGTAHGLGVDPHNPIQNLMGSARYFKSMLNTFGGNVRLALAAYNAGPAAVKHYNGVPPYPETQAYVNGIMSGLGHPAGAGAAMAPPGAGPKAGPLPNMMQGANTPVVPGMIPNPAMAGANPLQAALTMSQPSAASVGILGRLGGMAGRAATAAQAPIPLPAPAKIQPQPVAGANASFDNLPIKFPEMIPHGGGLNGGQPMHPGGNVQQRYPNLQAQSQADWVHVNPQLLKIINEVLEKHGLIGVITSGYRSTTYNTKIGGATGSRHQSGLAADVYVNGHPIGEVIPPEEWAKYGIRSGNVPGFFHGKPDPMHLDFAGTPIKGRK